MSASLGMQAVLLMRLHARPGQMVPVAALADGRMSVAVARAGLLSLLARGWVQVERDADEVIRAARACGPEPA